MCASRHAGVVKLVDAPDSKSGSARSVGSSPTARTILSGFDKRLWPTPGAPAAPARVLSLVERPDLAATNEAVPNAATPSGRHGGRDERTRAARAGVRRRIGGDRRGAGRRLSSRPAARFDRARAGADPVAGAAFRAEGRGGVLPARHRRAGGGDRAGAAARMAGAAWRALGAGRLPLRRFLPGPRQCRDRRGGGAGEQLGVAAARADRPHPHHGAPAGGGLCQPQPLDQRDGQQRRAPQGGACPHGDDRDAQFAALAAHHFGAVRDHPVLLRDPGDLLLPRRLDAGAPPHHHQPIELRQRDDAGARDPGRGGRYLVLHRHDHDHQRDAGLHRRGRGLSGRACRRR